MYTVYNQYASTVHEFDANSESELQELEEMMAGGPALYFVEVGEHWVKFQNSLYTTSPEMSIQIYPRDGDRFSKKNVIEILKRSRGFSIPMDVKWIENKLKGIKLDTGAVFSNEDDSISLCGHSFWEISEQSAARPLLRP